MVLRETGAGWLASMMRAEREDDHDRRSVAGFLLATIEPLLAEAQDHPAAND